MNKTHIKIAGYENIYVDCPLCTKENILNRVSDLTTRFPVSGGEIDCEYCKQTFWISGDQVTNGVWHWFMNELPILKQRKEYRAYVLNLCQAFESFFELAIVNKLIDRNPAVRDEYGDFISDEWNTRREKLDKTSINELRRLPFTSDSKKFKKATFDDLRNVFLALYKQEKENYLPKRRKLKEDKRALCFDAVQKTTLNETRNKVIHKQAYRPTKDEVDSFDVLEESIYWLYSYLDIMDSLHIANNKRYL